MSEKICVNSSFLSNKIILFYAELAILKFQNKLSKKETKITKHFRRKKVFIPKRQKDSRIDIILKAYLFRPVYDFA